MSSEVLPEHGASGVWCVMSALHGVSGIFVGRRTVDGLSAAVNSKLLPRPEPLLANARQNPCADDNVRAESPGRDGLEESPFPQGSSQCQHRYYHVATNRVIPGARLLLQSAGKVEPPLGTEYFKLFALTQPLPGLDQFTNRSLDPAGSEIPALLRLIKSASDWAETLREIVTGKRP